MTGRVRGYCMLKPPKKPGDPMVGLAGSEGRPVRIWPFPYGQGDLELLRLQAAHIENVLASIRCRIDYLETAGKTGRSGS